MRGEGPDRLETLFLAMKIHESMNVLNYTRKIFFFLLANFWLSSVVLGQTQTIQVLHPAVLKNGTYDIYFNHYNAGVRPQRNVTGNHGISYFNPSNNGNNNGPQGASSAARPC